MPSFAKDFRFPCRSGWCSIRGLALLALWVALVAGFLADTTMARTAPVGHGPRTVAESPAEPGAAS